MRPRLFWHAVSLQARSRMSYRTDFWLSAVASFVASFGVVYFVWTAMFRESGRARIGGRDLEGTLVYYLAVVVLGKLVRGNRFEGATSQDIYEGHLTRYLLYPAPYLGFKYAQRVGMMAPALVQLVLFGGLTLVLLGARVPVTPANAAMAVGAVVIGSLLFFLANTAIQFVAFWADNVWSLDVAFWFVASLLGGYMLPLSVFPDWARAATDLLPFRFFFDFPARVLLGEIGAAEWARGLAQAAAWCVVTWAAGRVVWHRGRLRYTGVGI